MYEIGKNVEKDVKKAFIYYKKSAEQGNASAQCSIGKFYERGIGVENDYEKAIEYYKKSADQGFWIAQHNLGVMYASGKGVEKDINKAIEYYEKAAEQGYIYSQHNLGVIYQSIHDYKKAFDWYKKSAAGNYPLSLYHLGVMYDDGKGVEKDSEKAFEYYKRAADLGVSDCQYNMGYFYYTGKNVEQDIEKAKAYLQKAVEQGDEDAKKLLEEITVIPEEVKKIWKFHDYGKGYFIQPAPVQGEHRKFIGRSFYTCNYLCPDCKNNIYKSNVRPELKGKVSLRTDTGIIYFSSVFYCPICGKMYTVGVVEGLDGLKLFPDGRMETFHSLSDGAVYELTDKDAAAKMAKILDEKAGVTVVK